MSSVKIIPVILSGGSGTRLWPLSRKQYPKQYLSLTGNKSMLQETILRLDGLANLEDPIIICNADHRFLLAEQCQQIGIDNPTILLEPVGKNTAPAIAAAALQALKDNDPEALTHETILIVLSADHVIQNIDAFHRAISIGLKQAQKGKLVVFGVKPTDANINYGYIKSSNANIDGVSVVEKFIEKPNLQKAQLYLKQPNYFWNSGMFVFQANTLIEELTIHSPGIVKAISKSVNNAVQDLDFIRLEENAFQSSPSDSIDFSLMEKSNKVVAVSLDADWNDIGSWSALYEIGEKDKSGNIIQGDVFTIKTENTYINASHHLVATIGVKDLIIVDTPNATLISTKDKSQEVKDIVEQLQLHNREEHFHQRKVFRPWGWFDSIESGEYFQVKRLYVNPGARLSLQKHFKRAEHWVVVRGIATVTNGEQFLTLNPGESTYIAIGVTHALENKTNNPLEVIEVQSGTYLGEDDIVRLEDIYGRAPG